MWINSEEKIPEDMEVVIALYLGHWPGRGNSGIADIYAIDGNWFNIPEGVAIVGWMPIPDTQHLPIAEHYTGLTVESRSGNLLGNIETDVPSIFECIFDGDHSEINPQKPEYESAGSGPVNPGDLDAEEQQAFFEQFADAMWRQPTQEEGAAFVKCLGKGTLVGLDENDNLLTWQSTSSSLTI